MRYYRRVIRIRAADSPNVKAGRPVIPGVLTLEEYEKRRATWDEVRQAIGLDAEFYEGAQVLLYPPAWLDRAERLADLLRAERVKRQPKAIGCDPGEGAASTAWAAVDDWGLVELLSKKTADTSVIVAETIAFGRRHGVPPDRWVFDRGGGGKQHADRLRAGVGHPPVRYPVRTVAFGESLAPEPQRHRAFFSERVELREERYTYVNRRAQMAHALRLLLDPAENEKGFALPREYTELRRQLAPMPLLYDGEGRIRMLSKAKRSENSTEKTLVDLLGASPDEFDAVMLAVHGMQQGDNRPRAGVA